MATKKTGKKKASKKKNGGDQLTDEPPIIVGGGGSEIIKIREDLLVTSMPPTGGYARFRVNGVNIKHVDVDGHGHTVSPSSNKVTFSE
jgi:hypothetical protein